MKKALYFEKLEDCKVRCHLCPKECLIHDGKIGICMGRENLGGTLYAKNYSLTTSIALDPIEKKPLYHFFPGRDILSIGPNGCNMNCKFCQNWQISQDEASTSKLLPEEAVDAARRSGSVGIAYTYSEPLTWYEYILDTTSLAREKGLKNVLVTNGYINKEPLKRLLPFIDAMNIDIKSMDDGFYRRECGATLAPVLRTVELASSASCHVEITNLVIPGLNDTDELFHRLTEWVASISPDIPLHFSRYGPCYKISIPPTPEASLCRAIEIASQKLHYVYIGNCDIRRRNNTYCHNCGKMVISRTGFFVTESYISNAHCDYCGKAIPIWGF